MRILLVTPASLDGRGLPVRFASALLPPLSLAVLHSVTPREHEVVVVNDICEEIDYDGGWDLVGITAITCRVERAYQIADRFRAHGVRVVLGGIHVSALPDEAQAHADAVVVGEAESRWRSVVSDAGQGRLRGRYEGPLVEHDGWVPPRFDGMNLKAYLRTPGDDYPMMPLFTTRGCPMGCVFCSVSRFFGRTYRQKPVGTVLAEVDGLGAPSLLFVDDNIAWNPGYLGELLDGLSHREVRWASQASLHLGRHPELIPRLREAGCEMLLLGIESLDQTALSAMGKRQNKPGEYHELFQRLKDAGIMPMASMMFGFDGDDLGTLARIFEFLAEEGVLGVVNVLTPLPGTPLRERLAREGRLLHSDWSLYDNTHLNHRLPGADPDEVSEALWKGYGDLYSIGRILGRNLGGLLRDRHPLRSFVESWMLQMYLRSQVRNRRDLLSGGLGRPARTRSART